MSERDESTATAEAMALLAELPLPRPGADARIRQTVQTSLVLAEQGRIRTRSMFVGFAAAMIVGVVGWVLVASRPTPLAMNLSTGGAWESHSLTAAVELRFAGAGAVGGTTEAPHIAWERGTLNVEVTPGEGVRLSVTTREAEVRVVGTGFSVVRDPLGTRVAVTHGTVAVSCVDGSEATLDQDESMMCVPTSAAALLGRARALATAGAPPEEVVATLDRALPVADGVLADEVKVQRILALAAAGRSEAARSAADAYLDTDATLRRRDVGRVRVDLAIAAGGCGGVLLDVEALARAPDASEADRARWQACNPTP